MTHELSPEQQAAHLVVEAEAVQPSDPTRAAGLFRTAAKLTGQAGNLSLCAAAFVLETQAWADAGDTDRCRDVGRLATRVIARMDDIDLRIAHLSNLAIALGAAGYDLDAIELLWEAHALLNRSPSRSGETEAVLLLNIA